MGGDKPVWPHYLTNQIMRKLKALNELVQLKEADLKLYLFMKTIT